MQIRARHFFFAIGYDPAFDADHTLTLCMFHKKDVQPGHIRFWFTFHCGIEAPRFFKVYDGAEYSHHWGAVNSARWTGRDCEIIGWHWPMWIEFRIGKRFMHARTRLIGRRMLGWQRRKQERIQRHQKELNSAMLTARMQDPRAPDWMIRARALNIAGL